MSIKSKLRIAAVSALSVGALAGSIALASGASASTTHPAPLPAACRVTPFSNKLTLTFLGHNYIYAARLRVTPIRPFFFGPNSVSLVSGTLCDPYEAVPLILPVHGVVFNGTPWSSASATRPLGWTLVRRACAPSAG